MRVLVAHNRYRSDQPSGENAVVDEELALLRNIPGVDVVEYQRSSDEIDAFGPLQRATLPVRPLWSSDAQRDLRQLIRDVRPQVLHLHNPYPLISPMAVRTAKAAGLGVVQTVHNYRLACVSGTLQRNGRSCTSCVGARFPVGSVRHACYRGSRAQSIAMAGTLAAHSGTWRAVDRFLALTPAIAQFLQQCNVPAARITVKANGVPDPGPSTGEGRGFAFVGRLNQEKGLPLLLEAWARFPVGALGPLYVVGDGPLRPLVDQAAQQRPDIVVRGLCSPAETSSVLASARVVVVPSTWAEPFSRVAAEALARSRPVLATAVGGLPDVVPADAGWLVQPSIDGLVAGLQRAAAEASDQHRAAARQTFLTRFHEQVVLGELLGVYRSVAGVPTGPVRQRPSGRVGAGGQ